MNFEPNENIQVEQPPIEHDPIDEMNKETAKTKSKIIKLIYVFFVIAIMGVGVYFSFIKEPKSNTPTTPFVPDCSQAYDCELYTKSEYKCKYKDEKNQEQEIKCNWEVVKPEQRKIYIPTTAETTTTTTTAAKKSGEKTTGIEWIDTNPIIIDYFMKNNVISDLYPVTEEIPSQFEKTYTKNYSLNGKNHVYEVYTYFYRNNNCGTGSPDENVKTLDCAINEQIFTIDGKVYKEGNRVIDGINYSFDDDIIKDTATGKEYFVVYNDFCLGACISEMMIFDDNNTMKYLAYIPARYSLVEDYKTARGFNIGKNKAYAYITDNYQSTSVVGAIFEMTNGKLSIRRDSNTWDGKWYGIE